MTGSSTTHQIMQPKTLHVSHEGESPATHSNLFPSNAESTGDGKGERKVLLAPGQLARQRGGSVLGNSKKRVNFKCKSSPESDFSGYEAADTTAIVGKEVNNGTTKRSKAEQQHDNQVVESSMNNERLKPSQQEFSTRSHSGRGRQKARRTYQGTRKAQTTHQGTILVYRGSVPGGKRRGKGKDRGGNRSRGKIKAARRHRHSPGMLALRHIRKYQSTCQLLIPKLPFRKLCRDICLDLGAQFQNLRWQSSALEALQEMAEAFLVREFEVTNALAIHAKRVTIQARDMKMADLVRQMLGGETYHMVD